MPTNEERREIAARLREKHGERQGTFEPQSMSIQAMNRLDDLLDCLPKRRDMLLDLADLIEPEPERTCEVLCVKHGPIFDVLRFSCCGYEWAENRTDRGATEPDPNYCPSCGAKVVDE